MFSEGDPFKALLYGAFCGCVVAIVLARAQRIQKVSQAKLALLFPVSRRPSNKARTYGGGRQVKPRAFLEKRSGAEAMISAS